MDDKALADIVTQYGSVLRRLADTPCNHTSSEWVTCVECLWGHIHEKDIDIERLRAEAKWAVDMRRERTWFQDRIAKLEAAVKAARKTISDNLDLADGDCCTLYELREALAALEGADDE